jgi:hypothetical protein
MVHQHLSGKLFAAASVGTARKSRMVPNESPTPVSTWRCFDKDD